MIFIFPRWYYIEFLRFGERAKELFPGRQDHRIFRCKMTGQKVGKIFLDSSWKGNLMSDMYSYDYFDIRIYIYTCTLRGLSLSKTAKLDDWKIGRHKFPFGMIHFSGAMLNFG